MQTEQRSQRFLLFLLVVATLLMLAAFFPIASSILLAAVVAATLWPLHVRISGRDGRHRRLSAMVLTWGFVVVLLAPAISLSALVIDEAGKGVTFVLDTMRSGGVERVVRRLPNPTRRLALDVLRRAEQLDIHTDLDAESATAVVSGAVAATGELLFHATMMVIALFFLLLQGDRGAGWIETVSPLSPEQTRSLLHEFKRVSYALVMSALVTSASQASAAAIGYLTVQVPHVAFFTALTFVAAFIPAIGGASICELCAVLLFLGGRTSAALLLALWGIVVVGLIDNVVKPLVIKNGVSVPGAVVFFALIGGMLAFGPIGLVIGPLAVAFFVALLRMYERPGRPPSLTDTAPRAAT